MLEYQTAASIIRRYTLTGVIELVSPLLIRAGVYNDIMNDTIDDVIVTYEDGQPFIPGTSLAGVLRQHIRSIEPDIENILFGSIDGAKGSQSALQINDIPLDNAKITIRDGIRMDYDLGVAVEGAKYDFEILEKGATGVFRMDCIVRQCHASAVEAIEQGLRTLGNLLYNGIYIGARTTNGLGRVISQNIDLQVYDFSDPNHVKSWLSDNPQGLPIAIPRESIVAFDDLDITVDGYFEDLVLIKSIFEQAWTEQTALFIPGTSLKGVLRNHCHRLLTILGYSDELEKSLFGYSHEESKKGRCIVDEVYVDRAKQVEQPRIRIDRFTGGVMNGALFHDYPIRNNKGDELYFPLHITVRQCNSAEAGLFLLIMKDFMTGQLIVGANRTIGYGRMAGVQMTVTYQGHSYTIDQSGSIIHTTMNTSDEAVAKLESFVQSFVALA